MVRIPCVHAGGVHNRYFVLLQVAIRVYLYNKIGPHMSEDNFLCFTPEDDDLAVLSMLDLELANILHNEWEA